MIIARCDVILNQLQSKRNPQYYNKIFIGNVMVKNIFLIVHFTVVCLVAKPLNRSEARVDFVVNFATFHM